MARRHSELGTLLRYISKEQVGEGTYGSVYLSYSKETERRVALKKLILHKEKDGFPLYAVREMKLLKMLRHPNIVQLEEIVTSKGCEHLERVGNKEHKNAGSAEGQPPAPSPLGSYYLVFEYVEHDLSGLIDEKHVFTIEAIKCIVKQLFEALAFIHKKHIVHRDIKSSNLLITKNYHLKLADFGLAREVPNEEFNGSSSSRRQLTNNVVTLWYKCPELLLGSREYSYGVDVWSAACVLAELELGRPLFVGKTEVEQLTEICRVIGKPTEESYPGLTAMPKYREVCKNISAEQGQELRTSWIAHSPKRVSAPCLALLEKVLVADPDRRLSAASVLQNRYFQVQPLPADPMQLPPIERGDLHEFVTKRRKKAEAAAKSRRVTGMGDDTATGGGGATAEAGVSITGGGAWATVGIGVDSGGGSSRLPPPPPPPPPLPQSSYRHAGGGDRRRFPYQHQHQHQHQHQQQHQYQYQYHQQHLNKPRGRSDARDR